MINISFDMETSDPDDVFTLCILSHHPKVNLTSVTVTPGSTHQIGLVKHILRLLNKDIIVGAKNKNHPKECVSEFHYNWLGKIPPAEPDGGGAEVLSYKLRQHPDLTVVCGAPLGNVGNLLDQDIRLSRLVVQGGFAGDNVVPAESVLEKFKGKLTCPTFNLNGDVQAALKVLSSSKIDTKMFVSKNVCHGVIYDHDMHQFVAPFKQRNLGLSLLFEGMTHYLKKVPTGKAFHDPLAACVAINPSICQFEKVNLFREKGAWGSQISDNPNALISVKVDMDSFKKTLVGD